MSCTGVRKSRASSITSTVNSTGASRPSNSFPSFSIHSQLVRHLTILRPRQNQVQDSKLYRGPDSSALLHCFALSSNRSSQPSYPFLLSPSQTPWPMLTLAHNFSSRVQLPEVPSAGSRDPASTTSHEFYFFCLRNFALLYGLVEAGVGCLINLKGGLPSPIEPLKTRSV